MTKLLEQAMEKLRNLPPELQDNVARVMLMYAGEDGSVIQLSPEEDADLAEAEAEADHGEFATDELVQAVWSKHGL
jgi:hypothetical protein